MDGLECRELSLQYVLGKSEGGRIDSHFFEKKYEDIVELVEKHSTKLLAELVEKKIQTGHTPSMKEEKYYGGSIAFIKTDNLRIGEIRPPFKDYLTIAGNKAISRTALQEKDIVTTIIGATENVIARSALVRKQHLPCNINQNIVQIRANGELIDSNYLSVYLNTYYGREYLVYYSRQMEQFNLNCEEVGMIKVPMFKSHLESKISAMVDEANLKTDEAERLYVEANELLSKELSLDTQTFSNSGLSIKLYSESYRTVGRMDAEYYQPKYDQLNAMLQNQYCVKLGDLVSIKKSIEPGSDNYSVDGIPFVRVSDVSEMGISNTDIYIEKSSIYNKAELYPKKDTILFTKDGSVGIAYKVEKDIEAITSSALLHLEVKDTNVVLPDYLTLVLNSIIVKMQAEREASGAIIQHWKPSEISKVTIPVIPMEMQKDISDKLKESFINRRNSEALVNKAKRAVEIAIEEDEAAAMRWLNMQNITYEGKRIKYDAIEVESLLNVAELQETELDR